MSFRSVYIVEYCFLILELRERDVNDSLIFLVAISSSLYCTIFSLAEDCDISTLL